MLATESRSRRTEAGSETTAEIEDGIESVNLVEGNKIWALALCSVIITPHGGWLAHPAPNHFDDAGCADDRCLPWIKTKQDVFSEYVDATAVAWDLSWHFIASPYRCE